MWTAIPTTSLKWPTYAYDYETAVYQDHVLVPYYNYEVKISGNIRKGKIAKLDHNAAMEAS